MSGRTPQRYPAIVYALRSIHVLIATFLSMCLVYLYYVMLSASQITPYVSGAMAALVAEGIVFLGFRRDCPFSIWQRKYGDEKGFFELFLPKSAARAAFPVLLIMSAVPFLAILWRALR